MLLGSETDKLLIKKLGVILNDMNATLIRSKHYVVGSQDISINLFKIGKFRLKVIQETYEGLVIKGHKSLVSLISQNIKK